MLKRCRTVLCVAGRGPRVCSSNSHLPLVATTVINIIVKLKITQKLDEQLDEAHQKINPIQIPPSHPLPVLSDVRFQIRERQVCALDVQAQGGKRGDGGGQIVRLVEDQDCALWQRWRREDIALHHIILAAPSGKLWGAVTKNPSEASEIARYN